MELIFIRFQLCQNLYERVYSKLFHNRCREFRNSSSRPLSKHFCKFGCSSVSSSAWPVMGIRSCFSECTGCLEDCRQDVYHKTFEVNAFRLCTQEIFTYLQVKRNRTRTPRTSLLNHEKVLESFKVANFQQNHGMLHNLFHYCRFADDSQLGLTYRTRTFW